MSSRYGLRGPHRGVRRRRSRRHAKLQRADDVGGGRVDDVHGDRYRDGSRSVPQCGHRDGSLGQRRKFRDGDRFRSEQLRRHLSGGDQEVHQRRGRRRGAGSVDHGRQPDHLGVQGDEHRYGESHRHQRHGRPRCCRQLFRSDDARTRCVNDVHRIGNGDVGSIQQRRNGHRDLGSRGFSGTATTPIPVTISA